MKKRACILVLVLFCGGLIQAQTKEETIAWLKEKLANYLVKGDIFYGTYSNIKLESLNECEFTISYVERQIINDTQYPFSKTDKTMYYTCTAPTTIDKVVDYLKYDLKVVKTTSKGNSLVNNMTAYTYKEDLSYRDFIPLAIQEREAGIRARVDKALKHLATFCPKKKEVF